MLMALVLLHVLLRVLTAALLQCQSCSTPCSSLLVHPLADVSCSSGPTATPAAGVAMVAALCATV